MRQHGAPAALPRATWVPAMNSSAALHVFAACSAEDASGWRRTRLENLKRTMRVWALPFECVGGGNRWRGFGEMAAQYAAAAERLSLIHI